MEQDCITCVGCVKLWDATDRNCSVLVRETPSTLWIPAFGDLCVTGAFRRKPESRTRLNTGAQLADTGVSPSPQPSPVKGEGVTQRSPFAGSPVTVAVRIASSSRSLNTHDRSSPQGSPHPNPPPDLDVWGGRLPHGPWIRTRRGWVPAPDFSGAGSSRERRRWGIWAAPRLELRREAAKLGRAPIPTIDEEPPDA